VRTFGSDAGTPNVEEKPALLARLLADLMERDGTPSLSGDRQRAVDEARAVLTDPEARQRFDRALAYAELVYPLREDNVLWTDQLPTGLLRRVGMELGQRLVRRGFLSSKEDAAMLTADELRGTLLGPASAPLRSLVQRRKCELAWVRANPGPAVHGPAPGVLPDLRGLPAASRRVNGAMLWEFDQELAVRTATEVSTGRRARHRRRQRALAHRHRRT
jgi:pyruvate,water dikinase